MKERECVCCRESKCLAIGLDEATDQRILKLTISSLEVLILAKDLRGLRGLDGYGVRNWVGKIWHGGS